MINKNELQTCYCKECFKKQEEIECLKKENEKLKKAKSIPMPFIDEKLVKELKQENKDLEQENKRLQQLSCPNCGEKLLNPTGAELYDKILDYKQALEEIREIAKKQSGGCPEKSCEKQRKEMKCGTKCNAFHLRQIFKKINEVLND